MSQTPLMRYGMSNIKQEKIEYSPKYAFNKMGQSLFTKGILETIQDLTTKLPKKLGIHTTNRLAAAGFTYIDDDDTTVCKDCLLQISDWTLYMDPFQIHRERKPDCPFVNRISKESCLSGEIVNSSTSLNSTCRNTSSSNEQENSSERIIIESTDLDFSSNMLQEVDLLINVRRRGFSHWPHSTTTFSVRMIEAGFFNCNVGDRVICIYCNLICQQWTPHTYDPCEVHKTLSPNCVFVKAKLIRPAASSILIVNENSAGATTSIQSPGASNLEPLRSHEIVFTAACNPAYAELSKRHASFATWPNENLPSIDDFVRAGFVYTGTKTIVTCFYCNGSLQNWGANDNPMIEHARWFPHCAYAKQICGHELYTKIQESKRVQQERARANEVRNGSGAVNNNTTTNVRQLLIPDESTLSRLVAARLDLPISERLLDKYFKLSIIKRCWEDQLRFKQDDFESDSDLYIACLILQKQIEHIDGKKENIVIPSIRMRTIAQQNEVPSREQTSTTVQSLSNAPLTETDAIQCNDRSRSVDAPSTNISSNSCALCSTEADELGCIPCRQLVGCSCCGHSAGFCPVSSEKKDANVAANLK